MHKSAAFAPKTNPQPWMEQQQQQSFFTLKQPICFDWEATSELWEEIEYEAKKSKTPTNKSSDLLSLVRKEAVAIDAGISLSDAHAKLAFIRQSAEVLYSDVKACDIYFATALRALILRSIASAEREVGEAMEMSDSDRKALECKTLKFYAQQGLLGRPWDEESPCRKDFARIAQHLAKKNDGSKGPRRCYLSYEPQPSSFHLQEKWVHYFVDVLYQHLAMCGLEPIDRARDARVGDSIFDFVGEARSCQSAVLLCTATLLAKADDFHEGRGDNRPYEARPLVILDEFPRSRILPILISGTTLTSVPELYRSRAVDAREIGYLGMLREIVAHCYGKRFRKWMTDEEWYREYNHLWYVIKSNYSGLPTEPATVSSSSTVSLHV